MLQLVAVLPHSLFKIEKHPHQKCLELFSLEFLPYFTFHNDGVKSSPIWIGQIGLAVVLLIRAVKASQLLNSSEKSAKNAEVENNNIERQQQHKKTIRKITIRHQTGGYENKCYGTLEAYKLLLLLPAMLLYHSNSNNNNNANNGIGKKNCTT